MPVGLSFEARKRFRGRVLVSFGEPVAVSSYLAVYREEPAKALHTLTTAIQWAMEMVGVYERVSAACPGYRPTVFLAMTRDRGGLTAARALLDPERGVSEGLGKEGDVNQRSLAVRAARLI